VLLTGPRQSGKTTLARMLVKAYDSFDHDLAEHRVALMEKSWRRDCDLVIFDELHKMKSWKSWIKGIYDRSPRRKEPSAARRRDEGGRPRRETACRRGRQVDWTRDSIDGGPTGSSGRLSALAAEAMRVRLIDEIDREVVKDGGSTGTASHRERWGDPDHGFAIQARTGRRDHRASPFRRASAASPFDRRTSAPIGADWLVARP
jgi:hypothetical protein